MNIRISSIARWPLAIPSWPLAAFAVLALLLANMFAAGSAHAETRTLRLYYIHTKERAEITYKKDGRYIQSGLNQLNRFLRDWRRNEPTKMDPRLLDLVWEAYQRVGGKDYIHVVSAYRSPATNSMLRSRSKGVAEKSQHMLGRAMDFYIPGVKLAKLREAGLKMGGGGVGYYPTSGAPFVHLDVGSVRHWPRMNRRELVAVFPNGGTLHVPSDGKPLPNYEQALAAYKSKGRTGATINVASGGGSGGSGRGLLASLFGGGADEEEESGSDFQRLASVSPRDAGAASAVRRPAAAQAGRRTEPSSPEPSEPLPGVASSEPVVDAPEAAPVPVAEPQRQDDSPETIIAALSLKNVPIPGFAPRAAPPAAVAAVAAVAGPAEGAATAALVPVPTLRAPAEGDLAPARVALLSPTAADASGPTAPPAAPSAAVLAKAGPATPEPVVLVGESDIQLAAFAPVPELRPANGPIAELIAAMPPVRETAATRDERAVSGGASQRSAILAAAGKVAPDRAIATNVRTTPKAARPGPEDGKAERKPVVIPVDDIAAQWALEKAGRLQRALASAKEPSLAYKAIRKTPTQVYTSGFAPVLKEPDATRFSGNAVTFLSVAKFDATN